jgi:hypothetical protein
MKFGKLPAKRSLKMASLSNHMNMKTVSYPRVRAWERPIALGMLANDIVGDCTVAAMYHLRMTQRSVAQAGTPLIVTDAEAIADYSAITGYVEGDESTDNGAACMDVLNWYKKGGVLLGASTVDIQNVEMVKAAINTFGCLYTGFTVPQSMVDQLQSGTDPDWSFSSGDKPTNNGHCVNLVGYGADGVALDSWGKVYRTSWEFWQQWFTEAYAVVVPDWVKANGESPTGLDMPGLLAALPQS